MPFPIRVLSRQPTPSPEGSLSKKRGKKWTGTFIIIDIPITILIASHCKWRSIFLIKFWKSDSYDASTLTAKLTTYFLLTWVMVANVVKPSGCGKQYMWIIWDVLLSSNIRIILRFWETAHLPLPYANILPQVRTKC